MNLGPHLLGRRYERDDRDFAMESVLPPSDDMLGKTVQEIIDLGGFRSWRWLLSFWRWVKAKADPTPAPAPSPAPGPAPDPAPTSKVWDDTMILDQGQTGHCVGFGWAGFGNTDPIDDNYQNTDGHAIYYEAKVIDGEPKQENGSTVRAGAKAMQNRGRIATYVFSTNIESVKQWVLTQGPAVVGTKWTNDMFSPNAQGYVRPTGADAGGHCYGLIGYLADEDAFLFQNSWGTEWGLNGRFKMKVSDFETLLTSQGEACGTTELPLA